MLPQEYCIADPKRVFTSSHRAGRVSTSIGFLKISNTIPKKNNNGRNHLAFALSYAIECILLFKSTFDPLIDLQVNCLL